ncbi:Nrap protein [Aspergillus coremiiformis]|uniref:U3 small nucleolar RNA-associated protein 22 n=1 Tax=Aspergillus coremiiformis TaxID=138285 RepID=A0A5N6YY11_9EURO|nr:Nrap protein [Aspergillus coremiiformis]
MSTHIAKRRKLSPYPQITQKANQSNAPSPTDFSNTARNEISNMDNMTRRGKTDRSAELALTSGFYKSNFFKLQLDELLTDSRPNYDKQASRLQDTLHRLKEIIEQIPERPPKSAVEAEKELRNAHGIIVPYPEPRPGKDTQYSVSYSKPTNVNVVGSFALKTGVRASEPYTVDLAVTMPTTIFQEKDYINHRFFHKRAYYIACLAAGVKEAGSFNFEVKFAQQDGDSLRPLIILEPTDSKNGPKSVRSQIRIITATEDTLFPLVHTLPLKKNIRQGSTDHPEHPDPTPFYNAALRSEATVASFHKLLCSKIQECDSFRDACILGRIWLCQRGFGSAFQSGGFGGFEWTVLMALLFEGGGSSGKPVLLKSYSSYQLFKATVQFLAARNLTNPLLLFASDIRSPSGTPMLYDGQRGLNILYKMSPWSYSLLRHEATLTLKMLNESLDDNFEKVFIYKVNEPMLRFDRLVSLPLSDSSNVLRTIRNYNIIYEVITKALGDRVELIHLFGHGVEPWPVDRKCSRKSASATLLVGLNLNPENATRVVDHGPFAEQKDDAVIFRSFWGGKAELRRFKDGTIRESLVWSDQPSSSSIVYQILVYILQRHFNYAENEIKYIGDEYDEKLRNSGDGILSYSSPSFRLIADAFNSLEKSLQELDEIPLTARQLSPASPLCRYSALRVQNSSGIIHDPVDIVFQFESSSRWPDDLAAIQMTKVAFLIKIGDALVSSTAASSCKIGLENESSQMLNNAFLDISHTSGVVFRLRIHHDREKLLLERQLKDKGVSPQAKQELAYALSAYKRRFIQSPRLTQAIRTLCTRFPLLSPTIRLVKHWFNCHLFTGHINQEVVELLVVRIFTQPYPWDRPSSVMVGFLRTLHFLAHWDWQQDPLIVDLGGELDQCSIEAIRTRFSGWRSVDPVMNAVVLFVASDMDPDGATWTQFEMPPKVVASRMSMLAKGAVKLVREKGHALDISNLFQTSLTPYDFIINLRLKTLDDHPASVIKYKNLNGPDNKGRRAKSTIVRSFVCDLQTCFSPNILFFHGDEHCDVIAALWNPQATKPRSWSLKMPYSSCPLTFESSRKEGDEVSINHDAILREVSRLGGSLVDSIEILRMK